MKKLCKLIKKNMLKKDMDEYMTFINEPSYMCAKCGRAANSKKSVCKPVKIK